MTQVCPSFCPVFVIHPAKKHKQVYVFCRPADSAALGAQQRVNKRSTPVLILYLLTYTSKQHVILECCFFYSWFTESNKCHFSVISNQTVKKTQRHDPLNLILFICTDLHKSTDIKEQVVYG